MPTLQWFPLDMPVAPFPPVGAFEEPYPDYRSYSHRDYGNRVGIFRIMAVLDRLAAPGHLPTNGIIAERYPDLLAEVVRRRLGGGGVRSAHGSVPSRGADRPADEAGLIDETLASSGARPANRSLAGSPRAEPSHAARSTCSPSAVSRTCSTGRTTSCPTRYGRRPASSTPCPRRPIWTTRSASGRTTTRPASSRTP